MYTLMYIHVKHTNILDDIHCCIRVMEENKNLQICFSNSFIDKLMLEAKHLWPTSPQALPWLWGRKMRHGSETYCFVMFFIVSKSALEFCVFLVKNKACFSLFPWFHFAYRRSWPWTTCVADPTPAAYLKKCQCRPRHGNTEQHIQYTTCTPFT